MFRASVCALIIDLREVTVCLREGDRVLLTTSTNHYVLVQMRLSSDAGEDPGDVCDPTVHFSKA